MQFSSIFKALCKEKGITQQQALSDMGFSRNAAQKWASFKPSADALQKIAKYFEITVDELLATLDSGTEENKKTPTPEGERLSKDEFFALYEALDESTREAIRILLKAK